MMTTAIFIWFFLYQVICAVCIYYVSRVAAFILSAEIFNSYRCSVSYI